MSITMKIDAVQTRVEFDPDQDHFYGVAHLGPGPDAAGSPMTERTVTFFGRDPDELRTTFRASRDALLMRTSDES